VKILLKLSRLAFGDYYLSGLFMTSEFWSWLFWYELLLIGGYRSSMGWFPDRTSLGLLLLGIRFMLDPLDRSLCAAGNLFWVDWAGFLTSLWSEPPCLSMKTVLRFSFSFFTSTIFSPNLEINRFTSVPFRQMTTTTLKLLCSQNYKTYLYRTNRYIVAKRLGVTYHILKRQVWLVVRG